MDKALEILAMKLGVAVNELLAWYMKAVPAEWIDPVVCAIIFIPCFIISTRFVKMGMAADDMREEGKHTLGWVGGIFFGVVSFIMFILVVCELSEAIHATIAPEAYALDRVLEHFESKGD